MQAGSASLWNEVMGDTIAAVVQLLWWWQLDVVFSGAAEAGHGVMQHVRTGACFHCSRRIGPGFLWSIALAMHEVPCGRSFAICKEQPTGPSEAACTMILGAFTLVELHSEPQSTRLSWIAGLMRGKLQASRVLAFASASLLVAHLFIGRGQAPDLIAGPPVCAPPK